MELAGGRPRVAAVRRRERPVFGRSAPRHRHRRADRGGSAVCGHRDRRVRRTHAARGSLPDGPYRGRLFRDARPPGVDRSSGRNGGQRRRCGRDDWPQRRAGGTRAVCPPGYSPNRGSARVPRSAGVSSRAANHPCTACRAPGSGSAGASGVHAGPGEAGAHAEGSRAGRATRAAPAAASFTREDARACETHVASAVAGAREDRSAGNRRSCPEPVGS